MTRGRAGHPAYPMAHPPNGLPSAPSGGASSGVSLHSKVNSALARLVSHFTALPALVWWFRLESGLTDGLAFGRACGGHSSNHTTRSRGSGSAGHIPQTGNNVLGELCEESVLICTGPVEHEMVESRIHIRLDLRNSRVGV